MSTPELPREGDAFEGPSKTLTDAHFLFFSALTGDVHPIHYDVEYAKGNSLRQAARARPAAAVAHRARAPPTRATASRASSSSSRAAASSSRRWSATPSGRASASRRSGTKAAGRICRVATSLLNQRDEVLLEGFHVYRVLRDAPKEK